MIDGLNIDFNQQELENWMGWELTDEQWEELKQWVNDSVQEGLIEFQNKNNL
tara:strand:+ start:44 stop:199 length:156 start_codon:yes stop_codon:yes gene_type:complete